MTFGIDFDNAMIDIVLKGFERTGRGVISVEATERRCLKKSGPLAPQVLTMSRIS